jgi:Calcineurin-like phosphoesterase
LRFGLLTDPHYADADAKGTRFYRESLGKVRAAVAQLRAERAAFLGVLGDVKDMAAGEPEARTLSHLVAIEAEIQRFAGPTYHVLGNHDMDNLSKPQFVAHVTNTGITAGRSYYAFSNGGVRFVVLDATYDKNGHDYDHGKFDWRDANLPAAQLDWLAAELAATREPVIGFVHQRLDGEGDASIRNRAAARALLEASGKVLAVFQGHDHAGGHSLINGIHYYTLRAVVEGTGAASNAFALVEVAANLDLTVTGYHRAVSLALPRRG